MTPAERSDRDVAGPVTGLASPPRWAACVVAAALLWIFGYRVAELPAKWEESRRCLVAMEMIHRGDYVVPRLFGRAYLNKPPFQSWMIVLVSGNRFERVVPLAARLVSLFALAGICLLLWRIGPIAARRRAGPWPMLVFLSLGLTVQYGRAGEIDMIFSFLVFLAFGAFELGRRRESPATRWLLSQAILALAILTKGLAPIFFYPPILWLAWRGRHSAPRREWPHAVAGFVLLGVVVAIWVVPYSRFASSAMLHERLSSQLLDRTSGFAAGDWARHVAAYPLLLLGATLPWSLALFATGRERLRALVDQARVDPWIGLCAAAAGWAALLFLFVPGVQERYLLPALPAASVLIAAAIGRPDRKQHQGFLSRMAASWLYWVVLASLVAAAIAIGAGEPIDGFPTPVLPTAVISLGLVAALGFVASTGRWRSPYLPLLALGLVYGLYFAGPGEAREARRTVRFQQAGAALAAWIDRDDPVVYDYSVEWRIGFPVSHRIGRPGLRTAPAERSYYWIALEDRSPPEGARKLVVSEPFALYHVEQAVRARRPPHG